MARPVGEALRNHVTLEFGCFDWINLNAFAPRLQTHAVAPCVIFREGRGNPVPSSALMAPLARRFTEILERLARDQCVDVAAFRNGERKYGVTQSSLRSRVQRKVDPVGDFAQMAGLRR